MTPENYTNKFRYYVWLKQCFLQELRTIKSYMNTDTLGLNQETSRRLKSAIGYSRAVASSFQTKYRLLPSRA